MGEEVAEPRASARRWPVPLPPVDEFLDAADTAALSGHRRPDKPLLPRRLQSAAMVSRTALAALHRACEALHAMESKAPVPESTDLMSLNAMAPRAGRAPGSER